MNHRIDIKKPTLEVNIDGRLVFQSEGKWLFPLFELEEFLKQQSFDITRAVIRDKIIGKAAAFLILRLKARSVYGELMSKLAADLFDSYHLPYTYDKLVDRINCATEDILLDINNIDKAYQILSERASKNY